MMDSVEKEVLADLIEAVRTIAPQTLSLYLSWVRYGRSWPEMAPSVMQSFARC